MRREPSSACCTAISRIAPADETFLAFAQRHETEALKAMFDAEAAE